MSKRFFLSDIHMGPRRDPVSPRFVYDWLSKAEAERLANFLDHIKDNEAADTEVVLVGDVLDNWICPYDEEPPTFKEIFDANPEVVAGIKGLLGKGMKVTFLEGNHDMYLSQADLDAVFGSHANLKCLESYNERGIHAEHGHSFDSFNVKAQGGGANKDLPLGYFISRVVATKQANEDVSKEPICKIVKKVATALVDGDSLAVSVFDAIMEDAGINKNAAFIMQGGDVVTVAEVRDAYKKTKLGLSVADLRPKAETLSLGDDDVKLVIFGHTHGKVLDPLDLENEADPLFSPYTKVYANSGTWIEGRAPTYIEVDVDQKDSRLNYISLMEWKDGATRKVQGRFFNY
ncbi:hypothetical protein MNBD_DELTA01-961 [hydrothermal vent metagenome]|uniref:Calcineurin-like phosphoesterase domain-containing protein n=1 Tax=hydrothermal vent metagenome TaxID=652676 RepID=A0A3B0QVU7_9ZZZZ